MFRVLIVDDEKIVRDSLSWILNQEFAAELEILTARNGLECIDIACEQHPDIILLDIRMPGLSGLDAAEEIFSVIPDCSVIFISAHEEFEFARKALQLGAVDFINKPVNKTEIIKIIRKTMGSLSRKRLEKQSLLKMRNRFFLTKPVLEQNLIYAIMFSDGILGPDLLDIGEFREALSEGGWIVTLQYLPADSRTISSTLFPAEIYSSLSQKLRTEFSCIVGPAVLDRFSFLLTDQQGYASSDSTLWIKETLETFFNSLPEDTVSCIRVGAGSHTEMDDFHISYQQSLDILANTDRRGVHLFGDIPSDSTEEDDRPDYIRHSEGPLVFEQHYRQGISLTDLKYFLLENAASAVHGMKKRNARMDGWLGSSRYLRDIATAEDFSTLQDCLGKVRFSLSKSVNREDELSDFLKKARNCIDHGFSDAGLSLESVAEECDINPAYLSARFREAFGINFMQYLTDRRMEKASSLLLNGDLSIKEICYLCGYRDPNYFSRLFRSRFRQTPSEFRRKGRME